MPSMRPPRSATPEPVDPESVSPSGPRRALKQAGLILLCLGWIVLGLIGHDPWKTEDATTFGVAWELSRGGDVAVPQLAGEPWVDGGPLVPALAAATMRAFSPPLAPHNAARLAAGILLFLVLAFASLASRELNGRAFRWLPVLILVGSIGFWERAHALSPEIGLTAGVAAGLWGLALALRRPVLGGIVLGLGAALAFLSTDFAGPLWLALTVAILPIASRTWRTPAHAVTSAVALAVALPLAGAWLYVLAQRSPDFYAAWLAANDWRSLFAPASAGNGFDPLYVAKNLPWFAWPAIPLALWMLWIRGRGFNGGIADAGVVLPGVLAIVILVGLSLERDPRLVSAMPILVPLALLAALEVDSLKRGFSSALDWFGILTFGLAAMLVWGIWIDSYVNGMSLRIARFFRDTEIGFQPTFKLWAMCAALGMTIFWIAMVRPARRSNRRAVLNWAIGVTLLWALVSTIWLPYIDSRRSYRIVAESLANEVPAGTCVAGRNLGEAQRALLAYFANLRTEREEAGRGAGCALVLAQLGRNDFDAPPPAGLTPVWEGQRRGDPTEKFVLYRRERPR
jgi:4-amino-4-deoxy-L-arabinose transferase-like glycosyltransferase